MSSHATNTSKTSFLASVMEAIKISDSTDNRQGHQLKGTLLPDSRGFTDFGKNKPESSVLLLEFSHKLFQIQGPKARKVDLHPTTSFANRYRAHRTPLPCSGRGSAKEDRAGLEGSSLRGSGTAVLELRARPG